MNVDWISDNDSRQTRPPVRCKEGCPLCANSGHISKKKDRLAAVSPKSAWVQLRRSARTLRQASASPKGKVGFVAHSARGDLQRFIRDVESKYFFVSLHYFQHGMGPLLVLIYQFAPAAKPVAAGANYLIPLIAFDVAWPSLADILASQRDVRFIPESGH